MPMAPRYCSDGGFEIISATPLEPRGHVLFTLEASMLNRISLALILLVAILSVAPCVAQSSEDFVDWRAKRKSLDRGFADTLQDIALWCRSEGIPQQVAQTYALYQTRDLGRQYIFLPSEKPMPALRKGKLGQWLAKITEAKKEHAAAIFELAEESAEEGADAIAFQFLHEVIYYNRDHEKTRRILGHKAVENGWRVNTDKIKIKKPSRELELLGWPGRSYLTVSTPHFTINSTATEEETRYLAQQLERWHDVWRQVFFEYWSPAKVSRWIDGKGAFHEPKQRYRVAFFKDHQQYVSSLERWVKGVGNSAGYYNRDLKLSFFPAGDDDATRDTWRHELTHQLFRETIRARENPFARQHLWLDEGIAMYFESLVDRGGYVTLGGFDTRRLQFARVRKLREGFFVPLEQLAFTSQTNFQKRTDIAALYSQSAGMTHMLMNDKHGQMQPKVTEFMKAIHKQRVKPDAFEKLMGKSLPQLDLEYLRYLEVKSSDVVTHLSNPELRTELALPNADLSEEAIAKIAECTNLKWLDLTGTRITSKGLATLSQCDALRQLFLTSCPIETSAYRYLANFDSLEEVDFSGSSLTDQDLQQVVSKLPLKVIRLSRTRVTDAGVNSLTRMKTLTTLDVSRSKISPQAQAMLRSAIPALDIIQ
jgi:hypothetical protein